MSVPFNFTVGEQTIDLKIKKFRISFSKTLKTHIPDYAGAADLSRNILVSGINSGMVENVVLLECLEELKVNGKKVPIEPDDPLKNLPDYDDEDYCENVDDEIMRRVVEVNSVLHSKPRYARVFGVYAPETEDADSGEAKTDPTEPEDTSTNSSSSSSATLPPLASVPKHEGTESTPSQERNVS